MNDRRKGSGARRSDAENRCAETPNRERQNRDREGRHRGNRADATSGAHDLRVAEAPYEHVMREQVHSERELVALLYRVEKSDLPLLVSRIQMKKRFDQPLSPGASNSKAFTMGQAVGACFSSFG